MFSVSGVFDGTIRRVSRFSNNSENSSTARTAAMRVGKKQTSYGPPSLDSRRSDQPPLEVSSWILYLTIRARRGFSGFQHSGFNRPLDAMRGFLLRFIQTRTVAKNDRRKVRVSTVRTFDRAGESIAGANSRFD